MMYDFKAFSVFACVVEQGSMNLAAQKLAMTPSAISQTIQKLEMQLQMKLLHRTTRKLSLTEAGETFYQHVAQMQKNAENAVKSIDLLRSQPIGRLNITCVSGLMDSYLLNAFKVVLEKHPEFHLNIAFDDRIIDLAEHQVDISLRSGIGVLSDSMIARHIFDFEWVVCASPHYFSQRPLPQTLTELAELDWISFSNERMAKLDFQQGERSQQIVPRYRINANTLYVSRKLTLKGLGVSIQPLEDVRQALQSGELIPLCSEWQLPSTPLYLVTLQRIQSEKVRIACDLISDYFQQLAGK